MSEHPYGWLSLTPPVAAICLAIVTRRVVVSLAAGVFMGALITAKWDPVTALVSTLEVHLWTTLVDPGKLRVFAFTLLMGAMIGVINRCGGMRGLVELVTPLASTRKRGQITGWLLGLIVFFDDYANTLLLGNTLRPLFDRLKISREKLAYIVDSTAAPVAGLALVSTWVAVEIDYVQEGIVNLGRSGEELNAFQLFIESIPYRFYMLMALVFVPLTAVLGRDFGPMLRAERRRSADEASTRSDGQFLVAMDTQPEANTPARWLNAVLPIGLTLSVVVWLIYVTGKNASLESASNVQPTLRDIFGAADSSVALKYGALSGLCLVGLLARLQRLLTGPQILEAAMSGARVVLPAIMILWTASTISRMTGNSSPFPETSTYQIEQETDPYAFREYRLYTGDFLNGLLSQSASETGGDTGTTKSRLTSWFPTIVFGLSAVVAFCTGTSWGTMGILMPSIIPLAQILLTRDGIEFSSHDPVLLGSIAGVLSGAVFGDHCSPISDTTVLSSQASGCDHIAHVWTQMPYAVTVALICVVFGTLPLGYGVPVWALLATQLVAMVFLLRLLGARVDENSADG